ncbi:hypothetical protein DV735_g4195, partial [Chaetothyriales sp. CBS 134920]
MAQLTKLNIGVLIATTTQILDLGAIDLFAMTEKFYLRTGEGSQSIAELGLDEVNIHYISENVQAPVEAPLGLHTNRAFAAPEQITLIRTSAKLSMQLTADITSPFVAPGKLDILVIPGQDPQFPPSPATAEFVRNHANTGTVDIITICSGAALAAQTGILDGKTATGSRVLVETYLRKTFPKVNWTTDRRWVVDESGRFWSSGTATNGQDLVAAYLRKKVHPAVAEQVCAIADVGNRPVRYDQTESARQQ